VSILSDEQVKKLIDVGRGLAPEVRNSGDASLPVEVLLRLPDMPPRAWMIAYADPDDTDRVFGFSHIEGEEPRFGFIRISELEQLQGYRGRGIYHDPMFKDATRFSLERYADDARMFGAVTLTFTVVVDMSDLPPAPTRRGAKKKSEDRR